MGFYIFISDTLENIISHYDVAFDQLLTLVSHLTLNIDQQR
jgi:hypothetical protein